MQKAHLSLPHILCYHYLKFCCETIECQWAHPCMVFIIMFINLFCIACAICMVTFHAFMWGEKRERTIFCFQAVKDYCQQFDETFTRCYGAMKHFVSNSTQYYNAKNVSIIKWGKQIIRLSSDTFPMNFSLIWVDKGCKTRKYCTQLCTFSYIPARGICFAQTMQNCVKSWLVRTQDRTLKYVDETFSSSVSLFSVYCTEEKFLHLFNTLHSISSLFPLLMLVVATSRKIETYCPRNRRFEITDLKKLGHEIDFKYF